MQLRTKEADSYSLYTKQDEKHTRVYTGMSLVEGAEIGSATSVFFSSKMELMAFLKSEARPNHRRFADRLIKIDDITYKGIPKTFCGIWAGIAGEVMAPSQGQRANVELALAPSQGFNPDLVKLVVRTRNKQGVAKGTELLLDYGDAFDVTLPVLASGAEMQMLGPMDRYMKKSDSPGTIAGHQATENTKATGIGTEEEPEAKRQRTELLLGSGEEQEKVDDTEKTQPTPFADMEKFGEGDHLESSPTHFRCDLCFRILK